MAGLDVTHQALVLPADIARLEALGTRPGRVFADLMRFFADPPSRALRLGRAADPRRGRGGVAGRAGARRLDGRCGSTSRRPASTPAAGPSPIEHGLTGRPVNATVGLHVDRERLIDLVVDAVGSFG